MRGKERNEWGRIKTATFEFNKRRKKLYKLIGPKEALKEILFGARKWVI